MAVDIDTRKLDLVFKDVIANLHRGQVGNCRPMRNGCQISLHIVRSKRHIYQQLQKRDTSISSAKKSILVGWMLVTVESSWFA